jgi:hypothetical protein
MSYQHWLTLASPFILGGAILLIGKIWAWNERYQYRKDRERRERLTRKWGMS